MHLLLLHGQLFSCLGSKVGIKGNVGPNQRLYCHEMVFMTVSCQLQAIFSISVTVIACNVHILITCDIVELFRMTIKEYLAMNSYLCALKFSK